MNIFSGIASIISLTKNSKDLFSKENLMKFLDFIKDQIVSYVDQNDLLGEQKKAAVDVAVVSYVGEHFETDNAILEYLIDNLLIPMIPVITQFVYDCLKKAIAGLTE